MVHDHRANPAIAEKCRPLRAERKATVAKILSQIKRIRRLEQTQRAFLRQISALTKGHGVHWLHPEHFKQLSFDARRKHLRIDKSSDDIEHRAGFMAHNQAAERQQSRPILKARASENRVSLRNPRFFHLTHRNFILLTVNPN